MYETKQQVTRRKIRNGIRKEREAKEQKEQALIDILSIDLPHPRLADIILSSPFLIPPRRVSSSRMRQVNVKAGILRYHKER